MTTTHKAKALTAYLAERAERPCVPFSWHGANCMHFAFAYAAGVEGRPYLAHFAMPRSKTGARRLQRQAGGMAALMSAELGREPIAPAFAQLGDLVLLALDAADPEAVAGGICCGAHAVVLTEQGGTAWLPMAAATHAWRIGA